MRFSFSVFFGLFPFFLFGQIVDSVALKTVDSLIQVSRTLTNEKAFDNALKIGMDAEKLALQKCGPESIMYGNTCHNLGRVLSRQNAYEASKEWCLKALAIREKWLGKEHKDYLATLYILAVLAIQQGNYLEAEPICLEINHTKAKTLGKEHPDYLESLNTLGVLYLRMESFEKAEPYFLEQLTTLEQLTGKLHPDYAFYLSNLADLYLNMGTFDKAEDACLQLKHIQEITIGKSDEKYAETLNQLGVLYTRKGEYNKAELQLYEAKSIWENSSEKGHIQMAWVLTNLGNLYWTMNSFEKAERYYLEAKAIREKIAGKENSSYAWDLTNLGNLYCDKGEFEKAEAYYLEAINIRKGLQDNDKSGYASSLDNLGILYSQTGKYQKAEPLFEEAKAIREKVLGKEHREYCISLTNLSALNMDMGNLEKAKFYGLDAKNIKEKVIGKGNKSYVGSLDNLNRIYWRLGAFDSAQIYLIQTNEIERALMTKASSHLSEQELSSYIHNFKDGLNRDFSFCQLQPDIAAICYNNALFYKGFVLNCAARISKFAMPDSITAAQYRQFRNYNSRLAEAYTKPVAQRGNLADLEEKVNVLEKALVRSIAGFGEAFQQVNWQQVQQKLQPGEVAIEFVQYKFINPQPTDSLVYAALLIAPSIKAPIFIPLFEIKQLDAILQQGATLKPDYINTLYAYDAQRDQSLYALLWQPLETVLANLPSFVNASADKKNIYFSAGGLLHRLNLGAIAVPPNLQGQSVEKTLSDRYHFVELGSTRQLAIPSKLSAKGSEALLYGGIQYDSSDTKLADTELIDQSRTWEENMLFVNSDSTLRGGKWNYLKWTDVEVDAAAALLTDVGLKPTIQRGYSATEESFKAIGVSKPSPRILHLATHGFFFPDPGIAQKKGLQTRQESEPVFKISDHPMIRSGLILAGGNYAWQFGKPIHKGEDGILTAYEISQINLSNTELVVLSACETGLGEIQGNEGVYGLQRAFKIAGVKYLIMSLWQVPDFQTQELMTTFYSRWLEDKMSIPDAFNSAQKTMRNKYKDPFLWAGFVLVE